MVERVVGLLMDGILYCRFTLCMPAWLQLLLSCAALLAIESFHARTHRIAFKTPLMSLPKLKILCLHGKTQTKEVFRTKLGRIPHKLRHVAELTIIDAPHILETESSPENIARTWFYREPDSTNVNVESLLHTIRVLQQTWQDLGPFDGVFGFSQGGTIGSLMAGSLDRTSTDCNDKAQASLFPGLKFVICAGAVDIHHQLEARIEELGLPLRSPFKIPPEVSSLHIAGKADTSVPIASSLALSQRYTDALFIEHEQGHHIPSKPHVVGGIVDFVTKLYQRVVDGASTDVATATVVDFKM